MILLVDEDNKNKKALQLKFSRYEVKEIQQV